MNTRSLAIRAIMAVLGLIPLILLELSLRFFFPSLIEKKLHTLNKVEEGMKIFKTDLFLGWKLLPNSRNHLVIPAIKPIPNELNPRYWYLSSTNSLGYRTLEFQPEKGTDVYRIICLGDSTTFGWGINFPDVYSQKLEEFLNKQNPRSKKFEVLSCGIPGYTSRQGALLIKEEILPRYSPDLLVVAYGPCDSQMMEMPDSMTIKENNLLNNINNFFQEFAIYNLMKKIGQEISEKYMKSEVKNLVSRVSIEEMEENFAMIKRCAAEYDKQIIFLNIVSDYPERHDKMNEFFEREKCLYIDVTSLLRNHLEEVKTNPDFKSQVDFYIEYLGADFFYSKESFYLYLDSVHPNSIGHFLIAEALRKKIEENFIIK